MRTLVLFLLLVVAGCIHNRSNVTYVYSPVSTEGKSVVHAQGERRVDADKAAEVAMSGSQGGNPSAVTNGDAVNDKQDKTKAGARTGQAQGGAEQDAQVH
jgi:hypothetical protein